MFFVGINISKNNHVASMMDEFGKVLFFSKLTSYSSSLNNFEIGMEATDHY